MATATSLVQLTQAEWLAEAERRYGRSGRNMRFKCPSCGHIQSGKDFVDAGMTPEEAMNRVYFSCIGRWLKGRPADAFSGDPGPCNYTSGGLICIAPIAVVIEGRDEPLRVFDFADEPLAR